MKCNVPGCDKDAITNGKSGKCPLHAPLGEKEPGNFWTEFEGYFEKTEAEFEGGNLDAVLNCTGFVFPDTEDRFKSRVFEMEVSFENAEFVRADFTGAEFKQPVDFSTTLFKDNAVFKGVRFGGLAQFHQTKFERGALFGGAEFLTDVSFFGIAFNGATIFSNSKFKGGVSFKHSRFGVNNSEVALFAGVIIDGEADFSETAFAGQLSFRNSQFKLNCDFKNSKFSDDVDFDKSKFSRGVNFSGAIFKERTCFSRCRFGGDADFGGGRFEDKATFKYSQFQQESDFISTEWHEAADFREVIFLGRLYFIKAEFYKRAVFSGVKFVDLATFSDAKFSGVALFSLVSYGALLDFSSAIFDGHFTLIPRGDERYLDFSYATFGDNAVFREIHASEVNFNYVWIKSRGLLVFIRTNMGNWSFAYTPALVNAIFADVTWDNENIKNRKSTSDEAMANSGQITLGAAAEVYRLLRKNFEERLAYVDAGDFHIGEMIMVRKSFKDQKKLISWAVSWLYNGISRYGERFVRPLGALLLLGLIFSIGWFLLGIPKYDPSIKGQYLQALNFSYKSFFTLPSLDVCPAQFFLGLLQKALGAGIITLFVLALKRTFKR